MACMWLEEKETRRSHSASHTSALCGCCSTARMTATSMQSESHKRRRERREGNEGMGGVERAYMLSCCKSVELPLHFMTQTMSKERQSGGKDPDAFACNT